MSRYRPLRSYAYLNERDQKILNEMRAENTRLFDRTLKDFGLIALGTLVVGAAYALSSGDAQQSDTALPQRSHVPSTAATAKPAR